MKVGIYKYNCYKCSALVLFSYFPDIRTGKTNELFEKMFDSKLCKGCVEPIKQEVICLH